MLRFAVGAIVAAELAACGSDGTDERSNRGEAAGGSAGTGASHAGASSSAGAGRASAGSAGVSGGVVGSAGSAGQSPGDGSDSIDDLPHPDPGAVSETLSVGDGSPASCNEAALRAAVANAPDGALIQFNCGPQPVTIVLSAPLFIESKTLTFDGQALGKVALDGGGSSRLFVFSHRWWWEQTNPRLVLVIRNLTLQHAHGAAGGSHPFGNQEVKLDDGGAIVLSAHRGLVLENVAFIGNTSAGTGASIYGVGGELVLAKNVTWDGGFAQNAKVNGQDVNATSGGAIRVGGDSQVTLKNVELKDLRASEAAAGITMAWAKSKLRVQAGSFKRNICTKEAGEHTPGAILLHSTLFARITNSDFIENSGAEGAVKVLLANATFEHVVFDKNVARNGYGGAIMVDGLYDDSKADTEDPPGAMLLRDVQFLGNRTAKVARGGGMYTCLYGADDVLRIESSVFRDNVADGNEALPAGGGLFIDCATKAGSTYALNDVTFADNKTPAQTNPVHASFYFNTPNESGFSNVRVTSGADVLKSW